MDSRHFRAVGGEWVWVPAPPLHRASRLRLLVRAAADIAGIAGTVLGLPLRVAWFVARPAIRFVVALAYMAGVLVLIAYLVAHALPH